ncbi:hypothetical protein SEA_CHOCOLAT_81 [Arthrobacter phage Chocolat]|uniref:DNA methylase n=5 Tax=Klausavirus princesstrina TaxID=1984784 RepID=A0A286N494_9CAUD|nr:hypothetical protein SEA_CHOCOLAT_81 [Arthrobacter phage Chocolat]ASX98865.1 hypothetical protein SEA_KABREEZE_81 [Arthrobacter phage Kabreeze]ASX99089.1 hypothetical protein SEA_SCAVITO_82 [Arthrobacter phage Scavito]ASX99201.1 hypothetical protein SEA_TOPHAT_82 [Arthrobacter phage Tophat]QBP30453.1 hypothetical protein SEA_CHIPPER1996_82 [Arthrobacter phage Chipper1996]
MESGATSSAPQPDKLIPTPEAKLASSGPDYARANRAGSGGHDLTTAMHILHNESVEEVPESALLLTPVAAEGVKPSNTMGVERRLSTGQLFLTNQVVTIMGLDPSEDTGKLLPTPTTQETKSGPSQGSRNTPPLNHVVTDLLPTPIASDSKGTGPADANRETVQLRAITELLPTPMCGDAKQARNSTANRNKIPPTGIHAGDTLTDLFVPNGNTPIFPTPKGSDGEKGGPNQRGSSGDYALPAIGHLLPTPAANDSGNTPEEHLRKKPGRTQVTSLQVIADHGLIETGGKILPTPTVGNATGGNAQRGGDRSDEKLLPGLAVEMTEKDPSEINWGAYAPAIRRWERISGRMAPPPTTAAGRDGAQRLNPAFVEWMMGLNPGHVTGVDIPRSAMLKALGNGVCPQQAEVAINHLLAMFVRAYGLAA